MPNETINTALACAICELEAVATQLRMWAVQSERWGWSTNQVEPMRTKANEIDGVVYGLRFAQQEGERG